MLLAERQEHELGLLLFPFQKNTITFISEAIQNVLPFVRDKDVSRHLTTTQKSPLISAPESAAVQHQNINTSVALIHTHIYRSQ